MADSADVYVLSCPTALTVGTPFSASFRVVNTGTVPLDPAQRHRLGSQGPQDTGRWGRGRVALPGIIQPGGSQDFTVDGFVPQEAGTFQFAWQALQEGVRWLPKIAQSIQVTVAPGSGGGGGGGAGLTLPPFNVSKWRGPHPVGGVCSVLILNTGPIAADKKVWDMSINNDTERTIIIVGIDDWLGVSMGGRTDTQLWVARNSDGCFLFLSPRDHYADESQGNFRHHPRSHGFVVTPGDGLRFNFFANGFTPGAQFHYQTVFHYTG